MTDDTRIAGRYGLKPIEPDSRDLLFASLREDTAVLPKVPATFGVASEIPDSAWGMLGNDEWGDCFWAGRAHGTMVWTGYSTGTPAPMSTAATLGDYAAATGFVERYGPPGANNTDQGTDPRAGLNYCTKVGVHDAHGHAHKLGAYVFGEPGNWEHLLEMMLIFDVVGLGLRVPSNAQQQFEAGQPWQLVPGYGLLPIEGGHWVEGIDRVGHSMIEVVTWGRRQRVARSWLAEYCDCLVGMFSAESLLAGKDPAGLNTAAMLAALQALK